MGIKPVFRGDSQKDFHILRTGKKRHSDDKGSAKYPYDKGKQTAS
ncbi:hypothetical protein T4B_4072 [Trichinella pseudospiralis]|uniref:Uncharacterized protein n=1 Tax=Trichinella pseudospiralis TaxID=6337 RepID=A0A0V1EJD2_TRIPS|nr:hypothetical protein T4A_6689 [Trichinella pseudospiralis]KRZ01314.1 hypothetical protein T4B_4486 [Trichinella pseudospiralis]KRZ01368.1 hypothetical protein T4B_4072 [Trichinella pseudospiralis]KRZ23019.1 hypothetical protein T4C_4459 [Trichinella pseudospiralis]